MTNEATPKPATNNIQQRLCVTTETAVEATNEPKPAAAANERDGLEFPLAESLAVLARSRVPLVPAFPKDLIR